MKVRALAIGVIGLTLTGSIALAGGAEKAAPAAKSAPGAAAADKKAPGGAVGVGEGWNAEIAPDASGEIKLDEKQTEIVKKVSGYFAGIDDLKGLFVQTTGDGKKMKGKFFVKRPGRFRFDYSLPSKQIIISDGEWLAIQDLDLNNEDRFELDKTPFRLLLRKDVDLIRDAKVVEVQESGDSIVLAIRDKSPDAPGKIRLKFTTKPEMVVNEWVTTDAQGQDTKVEVSQLVKGEKIDVSMFRIEPVSLNKFHP